MPPGSDPNEETSGCWVKPEPGCAVVNMGDSMVKWSGEIVRSNIHDVVEPPGLQAKEHRYSGGWFLKPTNGTIMRALDDNPIIREAVEEIAAIWERTCLFEVEPAEECKGQERNL